MNLRQDALNILRETSRTFYIPISGLPPGLQEAVASGYLCMRAIDEIEDHPGLDNLTKAKLLRTVSLTLQAAADGFTVDNVSAALNTHQSLLLDVQTAVDGFAVDHLPAALKGQHATPLKSGDPPTGVASELPPAAALSKLNTHQSLLPEVTLRVGEWAQLAPESIAPRIWDATAAMADRMAYWASTGWKIHDEADLNRYTFSVAGAVGLLLSDLWAWYDGTQTNRVHAIGFGRGLQAVNFLRNRAEDLTRGVDFFPDGWSAEDLHVYARRNLKLADAYIQSLPLGPALDFCQIPQALAYGTLDALVRGEQKLSRTDVLTLIEQMAGRNS